MKFQERQGLNLFEVNREVLAEWDKQDLFHKSMSEREGQKEYVFFEGPPSANGHPGIHHVMARTIKDVFCRYKTMQGFLVKRKAGWDTHGLPVELGVEKELGITKEDIGKTISIEEYNAQCRRNVMMFTQEWADLSHLMGYWVDMEHPYITYENSYIETLWWLLKQLYNKGLLYKGHKIVPYCPRCGTPLSSHEVAQGYKDVKERSAVVRFKVKDEDAYVLAWTTTPWTLPSNVALCVNPEEAYTKVKAADGRTYYMAEALLDSVLGKLADEENGVKAYEILEEYKGKELEYKEYEPLFACAGNSAKKQNKKAHFVTCDEYVTMTDGTGRNAKVEGYSMGGKTGTAEKLPRGNGNYVLSFMGFAPAENPEVLVYVVIDEPNTEIQANSRLVTTLARNIMEEAFPYLNITKE